MKNIRMIDRIKYYFCVTLRETWLVLGVFLMLFPFIYIILSSGKTLSELQNSPFALPSSFQVFADNYLSAITGKIKLAGGLEINLFTPFFTMLENTLIVTAVALVFLLVCATPAGYALARKKFKGKGAFMLFVIFVQTVPLFGYLTAFYFLMSQIQFVNNLFGIGLVYVGTSLPVAIIFMQGFFVSFPVEVEEAAEIDGANELKKFLFVIVPMAKGIIVSIALINFMGYWNEYAIADLLIKEPTLRTINIGVMLSGAQTGSLSYDTYAFALLMLSILPSLFLFTVFQRGIIQGVAIGSVKG